jgi:hypothetical protein
MTLTRAWAGAVVLAVYVVSGVLTTGQQAAAQDSDNNSMARATLHVAIPAQPLSSALQAFGRLTHTLVMGETAQLGNRTSTSVSGDYTREQALRLLLEGTGLDARFVDSQSVAILPMPSGQGERPSPPSSVLVPLADIDGFENGDADYLELIQTTLTQALCRSPHTRPGGYRLVVQLRIDAAGAVSASRLIDSTGDAARDALIAQTVSSLKFDGGPPASFRQPVTILLRPQDGTVTNGCAAAGSQG